MFSGNSSWFRLAWAIFEPAPGGASPLVDSISAAIAADDPDLDAALELLGLIFG
jgi:hypothetical protein